ncbi:MAG: LysR family transcriptional regulator, partial [Alphaproteobacteria bacterium]
MQPRASDGKRIRFSLQQLSAFLQVSRSASLSEAARLMQVSQPALSRMIQRMEETIGQQLLDRSARQLRL